MVGLTKETSGSENTDHNDGEADAKDEANAGEKSKAGRKGRRKAKQSEVDSEVADLKDAEKDGDEPSEVAKPWVGIGGKPSGSSMVVSSVAPESPAYAAGIQTEDELLAINDFRLNGKISDRLEQFDIGETLEFLLSRRGQLLRIDVTPVAKNTFDWKLKFLKEPTKRQKRLLKSWLGE